MKERKTNSIKWLIFAILLYVIGDYILDHTAEFTFFLTIDWFSIAPIILVILVSTLLNALLYLLFVREVNESITFREIIQILVIARLMNKFIPQSGLIYRARILKKNNAISYGEFFTSFASFKLLELLATIIFAVLIVSVYQPGLKVAGYPLLPVMLGMGSILIVGTYGGRKLMVRIKHINEERNTIWQHYGRRVLDVLSNTFTLVHKPRLFVATLVIMGMKVLLSMLNLFLCFNMLGTMPSISELAVFVAMGSISTIIVVTPGNLGFKEMLYGLLAEGMGIGMAQGLSVTLIQRLASYIALTILVMIFTRKQIAAFIRRPFDN